MKMVSLKAVLGGWLLTMVVVKTVMAVDCLTVASLISSCSDFVKNGTPYPYQGSPCCDAMTTLGYLAYADFNLRSMCLCFIGIITSYGSRAAIAVGTLPGFCGVSFGFLVDPETDCR
ncbi:Bifunctional inhibitor/plant lipid transfer protein/seed storage helical domain-containing protein [Cynara cardunculus var. scolymus]|uniref:Bifunctional inhibitor/plant lipid transfer protein/seed storage helical domain-containing protein n=2 Tax=Cynara cardunculus var. scolymus TaxID=59895 RepID=A0A103YJ89_CYNCS|nr:Bifunctional inhibitor/plant lipid transfer protein/seed storage helical domain-containing protein [Cynara cardunculus var. scolymus]